MDFTTKTTQTLLLFITTLGCCSMSNRDPLSGVNDNIELNNSGVNNTGVIESGVNNSLVNNSGVIDSGENNPNVNNSAVIYSDEKASGVKSSGLHYSDEKASGVNSSSGVTDYYSNWKDSEGNKSVEAVPKRPDITASEYYRLMKALLHNYQPNLRPVYSYRTATNVTLSIDIMAVLEVNERYQTLRHSSFFMKTWKDQFLTWDPADYGGLDVIQLPDDVAWTPILVVSNSVAEDNAMKGGGVVIVSSDGTVVHSPMSIQETLCSLDITFYPFDTQKCDVIISMWSSPDTEVKLSLLSAEMKSFFFTENSEWELVELTMESQPVLFLDQRYARYIVRFHLKRRRLFHCLTLIVPNVLLALLAGLVFALPQECGEKMSFSMSLLLAFAVNLSVLVTAMPRSSLQVSLLMIYLTSLSVATGISVVCTVGLLRLYHKVGVVGPKVTAFTLSLRNLFGLRQHYDVTVDGDDAHRQHDDKDLRHECQTSNVIGTQENDVLSNEWVSPDMINFSSGNECKQQKNSCNLTNRLLVRAHNPQRQVPVTWKTVAVTLDWLCCRVFVFVIVAMTSALVVALFIGP